MVNTNINWVSMNDKTIIASIGNYVKHQRLNQNITQAKVAKIAGINRWTISQIENGEAISLTSLIQILRALNLLNILDSFNINTQPSPLELAKIEQEARKRASDIIDKPKNKSQW
jgi:transcriptional regulator with XRE-family HTH domain